MNISKKIYLFTILILFSSILLYVTYRQSPSDLLLTLLITFGTVSYHLVMRLLVGLVIFLRFHNQINFRHPYFAEKPFEKQLYQSLKVKRWKRFLPTFAPETFNIRLQSPEKLAGATCQAEVVHSIIFFFSFVPILFSKWAGAAMVFILTSVLAALFDLIFVIIQRYNRPRILKFISHKKMTPVP